MEGHLAQETSEPSQPIRSRGPQTPGLISGCGAKFKLSELFIQSVPGAALTPGSVVAARASLIIHKPGGQVGRGEALSWT